jgi:hypothetical protein
MVHDPDATDIPGVRREDRYVWLNQRGPAEAEDIELSVTERAELHALRLARADLIDWCDRTKGATAVLIRRILDDAEARQRLAAAGLSPPAVERVLRGEEIAPGIRVLVDGDPLGEDEE